MARPARRAVERARFRESDAPVGSSTSFFLRVLRYVRSTARVMPERYAALLLVIGAPPVSAVSRIGLAY